MTGRAEQPLERAVGDREKQSHLDRARARMLADVRWGLAQPLKQLSSKYFYDTRGSELFERITELPEYYLTRTELALLEREVSEWIVELAPATLVELGAGAARKTRILLDAMVRSPGRHTYAPVDVAGEFLEETSAGVRSEYPGLDVRPQVRDITHRIDYADHLPSPHLYALIGSTIGNFDPPAAVDLLRNVRAAMGPEDHFLLGADLRPGPGKTKADLEAAYNDARGVTAAFNLNMLRVLNRGAGTDFDPDGYRHVAFYREDVGRIEMHLEAVQDQIVRVPGHADVRVARGETIRTEISCKYDRPTLEDLLGQADLELARWCTDADARYALLLARVR